MVSTGRRFLHTLVILVILALTLISAGCSGGGSGGGISTVSSGLVGTVDGYVYVPVGTKGAGMKLLTKAAPPPGYEALGDAVVTCTGCTSSTMTNASGYFALANVQYGAQTLTITKTGFGTFTTAVTVQSGLTTAMPGGSTELPPNARKWTILVYVAADNDLSPYGGADLDEIKQNVTNSEVHMVVQADFNPAAVPAGYWQNCRRVYMKDGAYQTVQDMGVTDTGSPAALQDFITWGVQNYPSQHYLVVLWNHGSGTKGKIPKKATGLPSTLNKSICSDYSAGTRLLITDVRQALSNSYTATGKKLDIIACDACLMGMFEVAYEWQSFCDYFVGSEELVAADGFPYTTCFTSVTTNADTTPLEFAKDIVQKYGAYYSTTPPYSGQPWRTCAAVQTAKLCDVATALDAFAETAMTDANGTDKWILQYSAVNSIYMGDPEFVDLFDFTLFTAGIGTPMGMTPSIVAKATDVANLFVTVADDQLIVKRYSLSQTYPLAEPLPSWGFPASRTCYDGGLSVYLPWSLPLNANYALLSYPTTRWSAFLNWLWL